MVESTTKYTLDKAVLDEELAKKQEWNIVFICNHEGKIITKKNLAEGPSEEEVKHFMGSLESRDKIVGSGFDLGGTHYEVLRFHPPLVYGRTGEPSSEWKGEGIAYCRVKSKVNNEHVHMVITYLLPVVSAKAIPEMLEFAKTFLGEPE
eukprot:TRINITY_DN2488_c0_g2_i5.p2 TRINITY_DN2488_c0_g2~~TRINITY_DN2488_c0_g2_i5.p2  ORF type:complete len:149 (-),score=50.99 TRINITY_DN2488_c0_g2_i5:178-624(-)